jgi:hypothetical protein
LRAAPIPLGKFAALFITGWPDVRADHDPENLNGGLIDAMNRP